MYDKILPIGSVVLLKNATKKVMILGYCRYKEGNPEKLFDYVGCLYPEGFLSVDTSILFDHEKIERIYALGFQNEERVLFEGKLIEGLKRLNRLGQTEGDI